jgi:hypothetical protein
MKYKKIFCSEAQWGIPATQDMEIGSQSDVGLGQKSETLSETQTESKRSECVTQVVEH